MASSRVQLWIKPDPFLIGVLKIPNRITQTLMMRIVSYVSEKRPDEFPLVQFNLWKHVACRKLAIPENLAWQYFILAIMLDDRGPQKLKRLEKNLALYKYNELDQAREKVTCNIYRLIIVLYLQKLNLSTGNSTGTETFWQENSEPKFKDFANEEETYLPFIQNYVGDLVKILMGHDDPQYVSLEVIEALEMLIEGCSDKDKQTRSLHELMEMQKRMCGATAEGYTLDKVLNWITGRLRVNPYNLLSKVQQPHCELISPPIRMKSERKISNVSTAPDGSKLVILHKLKNKTWVKECKEWISANMKVEKCYQSYIYLLCPAKSVTVSKCRSSIVTTGPIVTTVNVNCCKEVAVVTLARSIIVSDCRDCTFFISTSNPPVFVGNNSNITLAPYNCLYGCLENDMARVGMTGTPNYWNKPQSLSTEGKLVTAGSKNTIRKLTPEEFYLQTLPFDTDGTTTNVPGLKGRYKRQINKLRSQYNAWEKPNLTDEERSILKKLDMLKLQNRANDEDEQSEDRDTSAQKSAKRRLFNLKR